MPRLPTLRGFRAYIQTRPDRFFLAIAILWIMAMWCLDYRTGYRVRFAPLYLPAVFLFGWFTSFRQGIWLCLGVTMVWFSAILLTVGSFTSPEILAWNFSVRLGAYSAFYAVVFALRRERRFALTDALTGVANRRALFAFADRELARCRRDGLPMTVVFLDVDNFKGLNDRWGHKAGDQMLRFVARRAASFFRTSDLVARLGGDEFAILLPKTSASDAQEAIRAFKANLDQELAGSACPCTLSIGVVTFDQMPASGDLLLQHADRLMYQAKKSGKGTIKFWP